ncbi:ribokinase [Ornithinimicrobium sp.]|uniref:ribokinase n=1 Tax=Ornithinimicrobium sp. TaxID=1977084 RepID=UPI003D9B16D6
MIVLGSTNVDLVVQVDHRPVGGETILGSDLVTTPGGKGANQAVAAARIGGERFVGCVGGDTGGRLLRDSLSDAGVDLTGLQTVDAATGSAVILVTPDGENSIVVSPGANARLSPDRVAKVSSWWDDADALVLQLETPMDTVRAAARSARERDIRLVLNAAPATSLPTELLEMADPVVVNETETEAAAALGVAGADQEPASPAQTVERLLDLGPRSVVLTLGAEGAVCATRGSAVAAVPAREVQAVDTTGAGDGFVGALAVRLAAGDDLELTR